MLLKKRDVSKVDSNFFKVSRRRDLPVGRHNVPLRLFICQWNQDRKCRPKQGGLCQARVVCNGPALIAAARSSFGNDGQFFF